MTLFEIKALLANAGLLRADNAPHDQWIPSLSCNSNQVDKGALFFCKGAKFRPAYLQAAIEKGAGCYLSEQAYTSNVPHILVHDIRRAMPLIACVFYRHPDQRVPLVGITGTKGKTSCAYQLGRIFHHAYNGRYGLISTNQALCCERPLQKTGTTPEALELYGLLGEFDRHGAKAAVMEVSSQGLQYHRVDGLRFRVGIFLNLSPDHISPNEHKDFAEYKAAKKMLFQACDTGVFNLDDPYAREMMQSATCKKIKTISLQDETADFYAYDLRMNEQGLSFTLGGVVFQRRPLSLAMAGEFNVTNALGAVAAAQELGIGIDSIGKGLSEATAEGRMEQFSLGGVQVLVDYAHNRLSFEKVFDYADRFYPDAQKIVVYGCPGNKAPDRRKELSDIAGQRADRIVLTDDDPADESPEDIMEQTALLLQFHGAQYECIHDRFRAIARALSLARPGDLLLLLGKGHETTQIVEGNAIEYGGDRACVCKAFDQIRKHV